MERIPPGAGSAEAGAARPAGSGSQPSSSALPPQTPGFYLRNLAGNLPRWWSLRGTLAPSVPCHPPPHRQLPPPFRSQTVEPRLCWKMDAVHPSRAEPPAPPEPQERPTRRVVDRLSPELRMEKYILLSMDGKLLGPELSRIRSEMALPLERPDADLPQDLPAGYLCRQRRSLPTFPLPPGPQTPAELRGSSDVLCAGRFPAGLSRLVTGMQTPVSPRRRGSPPAPGTSRGGAGR
ncbi:uncharacterized protein LOC141937229 [Strix uralensis]|uniref:uncharacterized protein LOC141937229 n=1 Tax=Strix uralensis TaxID=36305 RepID=UPI003DA71FBF